MSTINMPNVTVQNIVATFNVQCTIDMQLLCKHIPFVEYNQKRFAAATLRLKEPRSTALIFSSGNLVCTGTRTVHDALLASRRFVSIIANQYPAKVQFTKFTIQNVVGSVVIENTMLNLRKMADDYQSVSSYEPEMFPGLICRKHRIVALAFRSGKIVLTGGKSTEEIHDVFASLYYPLFRKYFTYSGPSNSAEYHACIQQQRFDQSCFNQNNDFAIPDQ